MLAESALRAIYQAIGEGKHDLLASTYGLSNETILKLSSQNLTEREKLIQFATEIMDVNVNDQSLERFLLYVHEDQYNQDLIDHFLLQGAPLTLMRKIFGTHTIEFTQRRKFLGIPTNRGRPACDEQTELEILELWQKYNQVDRTLRYLHVAELTAQSISVIDMVVRHHESTLTSLQSQSIPSRCA